MQFRFERKFSCINENGTENSIPPFAGCIRMNNLLQDWAASYKYRLYDLFVVQKYLLFLMDIVIVS